MLRYIVSLCVFLVMSGCYSFRGIAIPEDVYTYYLESVQSSVPEAPVVLTQSMYQAILDKIRAETRLTYNEENPDVEISTVISTYSITYVAPQPDQNVASNRLTIGITVTYKDNKDEKRSWTSTFRHFADYSATANLLNVQEQLFQDITEELMEDFFNKAYGDW